MATTEQKVRQTTLDDGNTVETTRRTSDTVNDPVAEKEYHRNFAVRVVWFIAGILNALLALRFILALLGANTGNAFVSFIYGITYPFVAPFFGVFNYTFELGQARFEGFTLLAIVVYTLAAYAISRLLTLTERRNGETTV